MAIEAPFSKYGKNNFKIGIAICVFFAIYCGYDGYFNEKFKEKHTDAEGIADSTLAFNRKSPPYFLGAAVLLGAWLFAVKTKKIIADESAALIGAKEKIPYDSIQKIDKTHFDSKGYFIITYTDEHGGEVNRKLSDKKYDNLSAVLDHLVAKIS